MCRLADMHKKGDALASPFLGLFSPPAAAASLIHTQLRQLAVGAGHKLFEPVLKTGGTLGLGWIR